MSPSHSDMATPSGTGGLPLGRLFLAASGLGAVGCLLGLILAPKHFFFAYLVAFMAVLTPILGLLFFVMLHHVVDASWSTVVRRPAEQCLAAIPALAVLVLPVLLGAGMLFKWMDAGYVADDPLYDIKQPFLNVPFFLLRAVLYFAAWIWLERLFRGQSLRQDQTADARLSLRMRGRSGPGLVVYALTFSFAAIDWMMTLDFHWFSTIFGVYVFASGTSAGLAMLSLIILSLKRGPLAGKVGMDQVHDLGKLLFAFCVFWAYIAFSQWFLIWYANIPEETGWMLHRWDGHWRPVTFVVVICRFILPFVVLMSAVTKRQPVVLATVCVIVLLGHYVEMQWIAMPVLLGETLAFGRMWIDAAALLLVAGVCGFVIHRAMRAAPLYPRHDPRLAEALAAATGHHDDDEEDDEQADASESPSTTAPSA